MVNYQEGKIYKLSSISKNLVYYGSTCNMLIKRFSDHKTPKNRCSSKEVIDCGDAIIELVELFPCNSKIELHNREGYYIANNECVNKCIAGRTNKEWREDNKEHVANYDKEYREKHKEELKEKDRPRAILRQKRYRETEGYKEKQKLRAEKITCECGIILSKQSLNKHKNRKEHLEYLKNLE